MLWSRSYALRSYVRSSLWIVPFISLLLYTVVIRLVYAIGTRDRLAATRGRLGRIGNTEHSRDDHHADADIHRLHLRLPARGHSGRGRATDAADHRDHACCATTPSDSRSASSPSPFSLRSEYWPGWRQQFPPGIEFVAGFLGFCSIAAFLYLIDYAARLLRPVSIIWRVGEQGRAVIESVYPDLREDTDVATRPPGSFHLRTGSFNIAASPRSFWPSI